MSVLAGSRLIRQAMEETQRDGQASCIQTRTGNPVRIYMLDAAAGRVVHGASCRLGRDWKMFEWRLDGTLVEGVTRTFANDLIPATRGGHMWMNVCEGGERCNLYGSRQTADDDAGPDRLACVMIHWALGEGLQDE